MRTTRTPRCSWGRRRRAVTTGRCPVRGPASGPSAVERHALQSRCTGRERADGGEHELASRRVDTWGELADSGQARARQHASIAGLRCGRKRLSAVLANRTGPNYEDRTGMSLLASDRLWRCHEPAAVRAAAQTVGPTPRIVKGPAPRRAPGGPRRRPEGPAGPAPRRVVQPMGRARPDAVGLSSPWQRPTTGHGTAGPPGAQRPTRFQQHRSRDPSRAGGCRSRLRAPGAHAPVGHRRRAPPPPAGRGLDQPGPGRVGEPAGPHRSAPPAPRAGGRGAVLRAHRPHRRRDATRSGASRSSTRSATRSSSTGGPPPRSPSTGRRGATRWVSSGAATC